MKHLGRLVVLILLLVSCKDSNNHNAAAEPEPQEHRKATDSLLKTEENESPVHSISTEVKENILYARSEKFTIKIDRLRKGEFDIKFGIAPNLWLMSRISISVGRIPPSTLAYRKEAKACKLNQ